MTLTTIFPFTLPKGYLSPTGEVLRGGAMRLATALDEIESIQDPRVLRNEAYLPVILLSRVITRLGALEPVGPHVIEGLFAGDLAYLEDLYQRLNGIDEIKVGAICPHCSAKFQLQVSPLDGYIG
jgi:hypothetical protein